MQGEGIAFAKPGADEDFEEVGEWVVDDGAVAQEGDGLGGCPAGKVRLGRAWQGRVAGGVVLQAALPDGVAEGAGQGRDQAADRGWAAACGELLVDEAGDVQVVELLEADGAERGDQVLVDVVGVDGGVVGLSVRDFSASQVVR